MKYLPLIYLLGLLTPTASFAQEENATEAVTPDEEATDNAGEDSGQDDAENTLENTEEEEGVVIRTEIPKAIELKDKFSNFKILSPWSPKPMQPAPLGWQYIPAERSQSYTKKITLKTGKTLKLSITPYVLAPENSASVVQVLEPGYQPEKGYQQQYNIEASLKRSTTLLADTSEALDSSIKNLRELLQTLPKPEPQSNGN